jgi:hypothetical protein
MSDLTEKPECSAPAAFKGTYSDLKFIKSRKVCQITVEIPIEAGQAFVAAFGAPDPSQETWLAIARLDLSRVPAQPAGAKEHRAFADLPYPQQIALKGKDEDFQRFLGVSTEENCADYVRTLCHVVSRSEIKPGTPAGDRWIALLREFEGQRT